MRKQCLVAGGGLAAILLLTLNCTGAIGAGEPGGGGPGGPGPGGGGPGGPGPGGGGPGGPGQGVDPGAPAHGQLRRLSPAQFVRSLEDLLGPVGTLPPIEAPPAGASLKAVGASLTAFSPLGIEQFEAATQAAVYPLFADAKRRDALVGCAPAAWDETCARSFLTGFGRRAWRRPLAPDEMTRYLKLGADEAGATGQFSDGARAMTWAILQSPNFLYRVELGGGMPVAGKTWTRFTTYETATRLSYLLWSTTPDAQLLTAAETGALDTPDGIRKEVQRLLSSPRALDGLNEMVDDLLSLDAVNIMAKDPKVFPQLTPTLRQAMRGEILKMFEDVVLTRDADMMELYDSNRTFVNSELGKLYGINVPGTDLVAAQHPASIPRAGLLTSAALLTVQDKPYQTSPTRRGAFFWRVLMCEHIPDPPADVDVTIKPPPPGVLLTRRESLSGHATNAACKVCHGLMDPIGLAFENFDGMAVYRTKEENGLTIDPKGELDGTAFSGPKELGALVRQSAQARSCMARRIYRFATGRMENPYDEAQLTQLDKAFASAGQRIKGLLTNLVVSDGFRNVSAQ
ncbi:MAG TPA: DUF1592 domain-containing protein [Polyangia bacterium]|jgi:hypothetical protein|nr:DUF1592 domain-containing protein [Polyangia bacterium]